MAKAWVHGALADEDVAREAQGSISLLTPKVKPRRGSAGGAKSAKVLQCAAIQAECSSEVNVRRLMCIVAGACPWRDGLFV